MALPPWPALSTPTDGAPAVVGGEFTLHPPVPGSLWQVGFASTYELILREEGTLRRSSSDPRHAPVHLWAHMRAPALWAALGSDRDLLIRVPADLAPQPDGTLPIRAVDVWDRRREALLAHGAAREVLLRAQLTPPKVALLGDVRGPAELNARAHAVGAPGAVVELRREENGCVAERLLIKLGASRSPVWS